MPDSQPQLVLASTSVYRKSLLAQLGLPFKAQAPRFNEDSMKSQIKDPRLLAETLAFKKAESLAGPGLCVIGGDQLVRFENEILGKPKSFENACAQLQKMSGRSHQLITAVSILCNSQHLPLLDITEIRFRKLSPQEIENYVRLDEPYDCAGSYKIEKAGLTLCESVTSKDFSAIQGLPLMSLTQALIQLGYTVPGKERPSL